VAPFLGPIVIFLLWSLVSFSYAIDTYAVLQRWTTWAAAFIFFILAVDLFTDEERVSDVLTVVFLAGAGIALIGIFQHLNGLEFIPQASSPSSTFGHKNMAIHYIILAIPAGFGLFITSKKEWVRLAFPCLFTLQVTYLIFSRTRAGWLAFFVEIIFLTSFIIWTKNHNKFRWDLVKSRGIIYGLILFFSLIGLEQISPHVGKQTFSAKIHHTMSQMSSPEKQARVAHWLNTVAMIKDYPALGVGVGNFATHYPLYHRKVRKDPRFNVTVHVNAPHNDYLQILVETGLIGFVILIWALFRVGNSLTWVFKKSRFSAKNIHAIGLITALLGIGVVACFSFPLQMSTPPLLTFIYLALLASLTGNTKEVGLRKKQIITGSLIVGASSIFLISHQWDRLYSEFHLTKARAHFFAENYPASTKHALKAYTIEPQRKENLYYLGLASLYNGQTKPAIHFLEKDLRAEPNNINALSALGLAYGKLRG
nr:O-antigen ligase family protein [Spirochaetales bacterium]